MIGNSIFDSNTSWIMLLGNYAARYTQEAVWNAPRSLRVGMAPGDNYAGFSSARNPLTLPADATSATLTLRYLPQTGSANDEDRQYIGILNQSDAYIPIVPSALNHADEWQSVTYDLQDQIGQTINLYIGVKNDGTANSTRLYVDDIQVMLCRN